MALTPQEQISEGRVFAVFKTPTAGEQVSEGLVFEVAHVTGPQRISQAQIFAVTKVLGPQQVSEGRVFAVVHGRIENPRIRPWTFTLDGHDFYVLRLGDAATIVYDVYSEQWVDWDSQNLPMWRANTGITWNGAEALAATYGSSIVVGDDTFGLLWFLDPELPYDENPDSSRVPQQLSFDRVVTGQTLAKGRQYIPCYAIFLNGDNYGLTADDFTPTIMLEISDDQGRNFVTIDVLTQEPDLAMNNPYSWFSLGQINSPGRIFRVTDNGIYTRIDSMEMNDDAG